jgi:ArsR family transcriptional regulator
MENYFKALSDKTRLEMFLLISINTDICLCKIEECFNLSNSNLSRHLKELERSKLIESNKQGIWKHYTITTLGQQFIKFINKLDNQTLLNRINAKNALLSKDKNC